MLESADIKTSSFVFASIALVGLHLLFPGDARWINDEALLLDRAFHANAKGELLTVGLTGSLRMPYGAVPSWIYQFLLLLTHDLIFLTVIKTALSIFCLLGALWGIAKKLKLSPWPMLLVMVSPYFYLWNRALWDNCFIIPLSALLFYFYLEAVAKRSRIFLFASIILSSALLQIHLMAGFVLLPMWLAFLWYQRSWIKEDWLRVSGLAVFGLATLYPYLALVLTKDSKRVSDKAAIFDSVKASFSAPRLLSFQGFDKYYLPEMHNGWFFTSSTTTQALMLLSSFVVVLFVLGLVLSIVQALGFSHQSEKSLLYQQLNRICLGVLGFTVVAYSVVRMKHHPHYLNAVWFPFFFFVWIGAQWLARNIYGKLAVCSGFLASLVLLIGVVSFVHKNGGTRGYHYGPTLANQIEVIKRYHRFDPRSTLDIEFPGYKRYPHAFKVLRTFYRPSPPPENRSIAKLKIDYRDGRQGSTGWIELQSR